MSYIKSPPPGGADPVRILEYVRLELDRIGAAVADNAPVVFYRTNPAQHSSLSVSNGSSANWKISGNVLLVSTSVTQTFTGIQRNTQPLIDGMKEIVFINIGTGVAVLKTAGSESSASNQFALPISWQLSANAAAILWRDPFAARWRGISRT